MHLFNIALNPQKTTCEPVLQKSPLLHPCDHIAVVDSTKDLGYVCKCMNDNYNEQGNKCTIKPDKDCKCDRKNAYCDGTQCICLPGFAYDTTTKLCEVITPIGKRSFKLSLLYKF